MRKLLFLLLLSLALQAQTIHPVQVNLNLVPPYSTRISDYANNPGKVLITLRNTQSREITVYLRASISGENGIAVFTKPDYRALRGITLKPNVPFTLSVADLQEVFDIRQLSSKGMSFQEIERKNGLPEGAYDICVRAYDFTSQTVPLSSESPFGCTTVRLTSLEPPLLIKPFAEESVPALSPQNILFSWNIPPGAPLGLRYTLRLVEIFDEKRNANDAYLSSATFFEKELMNNVYVYGPADPPLVAGRRYAWAVTAGSRGDEAAFRNQGRSEIRSFRFGVKAAPASSFNLTGIKMDPKLNIKKMITTVSGKLMYSYPEDYGLVNSPDGKRVADAHFGTKLLKRGGKVANSYLYDIPAYLQASSSAKPAKNVKITVALVYAHKDKNGDLLGASIQADRGWNILNQIPGNTTFTPNKVKVSQAVQILGTAYSNEKGEFNLAFPLLDSSQNVAVQFSKTVAEFGLNHSGVMRKTCVLFIDSPYYSTPLVMMDAWPGDQIVLPELVSLVKSQELSLLAKNSQAEGQMGGKDAALENVNVELFRLKPVEADLPEGEGQQLASSAVQALQMGDFAKTYPIEKLARVVAMGKTDAKGKIVIPRVIRFNPDYNEAFVAHTYSDKNTGVYNKFDGLHVIDKQVLKSGIAIDVSYPFLRYTPVFNTLYAYKTEEISTVMHSRKPMVKGKVVEMTKGLSDVQVFLKQKIKTTKHFDFFGHAQEVSTTEFKYRAALITKTDGYFEFKDLDPGDYLLEFVKSGYRAVLYNGNIVYPPSSHGPSPYTYTSDLGFSLKSGQLLQTNEIAMKTGGSVFACISDEDGNRVVADVQIGGGAFYKTAESGLMKGCYNFPAPAGKNRKVNVKPRATAIFFDEEFTVDVLEGELTKVPANQWVLKRKKHRLQVDVRAKMGSRQVPVADAEVRIKEFVTKTDADGRALLSFESPGTAFVLEVKPQGNFSRWENEVKVPVSKVPKVERVELLPAKSLVATVIDGLKKPVPGAKVYVKKVSAGWGNATENYSECVTGRDGKCTLQGIPSTEVKIEVFAARDNYIGDKKEITWPAGSAEMPVMLQLKSGQGFLLKDIWGLPVQVETAEALGQGKYLVSGSFKNLPTNPNFSGKDLRLDFKNVRVKPSPAGENSHVPENAQVDLEQKSFRVGVGTELQGTAQVHVTGPSLVFPKLSVRPDEKGKGAVMAGVNLELSSFEGAYQLSGKISLHEKEGLSDVKVFSAGELAERKFRLEIKSGANKLLNTAFKVHNFPAEADGNLSYLSRDSVRIFTVLHTQIKDMVPADLAIKAGYITVLPDKILPFTGGDDLRFTLEKWQVTGQKSGAAPVWKYDLNNGGITVEKAMVNTGIVGVTLRDLVIKPDRLLADKLELDQKDGFSLGGIVPLELQPGTQGIFSYDPNCYHDQKPHWKFSLIGKNGGLAARVKNLDGMAKNDVLEFGSMNLFSDSQQQLNGPAAKKMTLFNVLDFRLNTLDVGKDFFTLVGQANLAIPNLSANGGAIVGQILYAKNSSGQVKAEVRPLFFDIEGKGQVNFRTDDAAKSQTLTDGLFTSKGKLKIYDTPSQSFFTVDAILRHQRNAQGFSTKIDILENQKIPLDGKGLAIKTANSGMKVEKGEWNNLVLETVLPESEFNNLAKSEKDRTLTFVVKGGIETDPDKGKLGLTGMDSPLGNLNLYYNFPRQEVRGDFTFVPPAPIPMGVVDVTSIGGGMVIGTGGVYVRATATGDISLAGVPLPLKGSANTVFGYYTKSLYPEDLKILSDFSVNKSLPLELNSGIKGFYTSVSLSASRSLGDIYSFAGSQVGFAVNAGIGFEYRTFVNFTSLTSFTLRSGLFGYGALDMSASATVLGVGASGSLNLSAQLAMETAASPQVGLSAKSFVNTLKSMELKGCAALTGNLNLEACTPLGCETLLAISKTFSIRFLVSKDPDFSLSLDPCGNFGMPLKVLTTP